MTVLSLVVRPLALAWAVAIVLPSGARAQTRTGIVAPTGDDHGLTAAVEQVLRARLGELGVGGELHATPLTWSDLVLATGCAGDDTACYAAVARELEVTELMLASAECSADDCVVDLVRWRPEGADHRLLRAGGERVRLRILELIAPALRDLYDLPPAPGSAHVALVEATRARHSFDPTGPLVLAGVGLGALGSAIAAAVAADASRRQWAAGTLTMGTDPNVIADARGRTEAETIATDILFGVACAAAGAALVWLFVDVLGARHDAAFARALVGSFAF